MCRILVLLSVVLFPSLSQAAQQFKVSGEIITAQFLGPFPVDFNEPAPAVPFPIPYDALLTYDPLAAEAKFQFTADVNGVPIDHTVGRVVGETFTGNFYSGIDQFDETTVVVDFLSSPAAFMTTFELNVDRATGQGSWQWQEACPVCFAALPSATATITSFRLIPEPTSATIAALAFAMLFHAAVRFRS